MSLPSIVGLTPQGYVIGASPRGHFGGFYNGAHYLFLFEYGQASAGLGDFKLHAYKSADGGNTWVEQDSSNAFSLLFEAPSQIHGYYSMSSPDGNIIHGIALHERSTFPGEVLDGFSTFSYNLGTDTWGTVSGLKTSPTLNFSNPSVSSNAFCVIDVLVRGTGDYVFTFNGATETVSGTPYGRVYACSWDGFTFGTPVMLPGQTGIAIGFTATRTALDSNGLSHFFLIDTNGSVYHVGMAAGAVGSFGSVSTVTANPGAFGDPGYISEPSIDVVSGTETLGIVMTVNDSGTGKAAISFYKANAVLNPTWTADPGNVITEDTSLVNSIGGNIVFDQNVVVNYLSGKYYCHFMVSVSEGGAVYDNGSVYQSSSSDGGITWSTPTKLWAAPNTATGNPYFLSQQLISYETGSNIFLGAAFYDGEDNPPNEGSMIYQFNEVTISSPSITCGSPPRAALGVPYSHYFSTTTSGGTPPYTWTVTGGTLPTGLTLGFGTGLLSGTPVAAGTFTFTITVTDVNSLTGTVTCSVVVASAVFCTIAINIAP